MRNRTENQIELVMIRHGATGSNREGRYLGRTDETLAKEGVRRLLEIKKTGYYPKVGRVFTSPMKRCIETAEILYPEKQAVIIEEWKEIDFGKFEGKHYTDLQNDIQYRNWMESGGTLPFPEGESREDFVRRCAAGMHKMLDLLFQGPGDIVGENEPVGMIVHGGTVMSILSRYGGGSYFDYQLSNGDGYRCSLRYQIKGTAKRRYQKWKITDIRKL